MLPNILSVNVLGLKFFSNTMQYLSCLLFANIQYMGSALSWRFVRHILIKDFQFLLKQF